MLSEMISTKRFFQILSYSVGHSELLLRSTKSAEFPTRIDVFSKGVKEFHLPSTFNGLSIAEAPRGEIRALRSFGKSPNTGYDFKESPWRMRS